MSDAVEPPSDGVTRTHVEAKPTQRERGTESRDGSASGQLEVRCPSCHVPMDVAVDTQLTDLTCDSCGSHFSLVDQSQATRIAPSLTKLGRFEIIERLGVGGYGSVWKARDKELDRTVALKIPRAGGMTPENRRSFSAKPALGASASSKHRQLPRGRPRRRQRPHRERFVRAFAWRLAHWSAAH